MNINDFFPSSLNAADLAEPTTYTIKKWDLHDFEEGGQTERKARIFFEETERYVVLNSTRRRKLVDLFGADPEKWNGQKVVVYKGTTMFQGRETDCVSLDAPGTPFD